MKKDLFYGDNEDDYLSYYFDKDARKILPRFDFSLVQLENLNDWLREENDSRRSPLYILDSLVFDQDIDYPHIFDRSGHQS